MYKEIINKLRQLEKKHNIKILFAVESGSRAWGHHNINSDYDIRFVYKSKDINEYLTINAENDVIESNDGLYDLVGWDIKKALKLHYKSNPNLREWTLSPIIYIEDEEDIFNNLPEFNITTLKHHYYGLTLRHYKKYLKTKTIHDFKYLKKMLYAVRCILTWKLLDENILPPMNLDKLLTQNSINPEFKNIILKLKQAYCELNMDKISDDDINLLYNWIEDSLKDMENDNNKVKEKRDISVYNKRFQKIVKTI